MDCPLCPHKNVMSKCFFLHVQIRSKYGISHICFIGKIIVGVKAKGQIIKMYFVFIIYLFSAYKLKREACMNIAYAKREEGQIMQLINTLWQKSTKNFERQEERDGCPSNTPQSPSCSRLSLTFSLFLLFLFFFFFLYFY